GFLAGRLARLQPTYHQPLPRPGGAPGPHSPWRVVVCGAASTRSRNRTDRADAEETARIRHACRWSSNTPPRTIGSARSWFDAGSFPTSTKPDAGTWRIDSAAG